MSLEEWHYPIRRLRHIDVAGDPVAQGSMVAVGSEGAMRHSSRELRAWREAVGWQARFAFGTEQPWEGPVRMDLLFRMPRPKSVPQAKRELPHVRPDRDKLLRGVSDALEGIAYHDDAQICAGDTCKRYVREGEEPGVLIRLALYGV